MVGELCRALFSLLFCGLFEKRGMTVFRWSSMVAEDVAHLVLLMIAKWISNRSKFDNLKVEGILHNWEVSLSSGPSKVVKVVFWVPPTREVLKFNVDETARGKPGLAGIGGVLCNSDGDVLVLFSKHVGSLMRQRLQLL